jgi:DNA-binding Xre family transcriptional regulator
MTKNVKSTCGEFLKSLTPKQKKQFDKEHKEFLISEMLIAAMQNDDVSVRELAKLAGVSPSIVQGVRSGIKKNVTVKTLSKLVKVFGYSIVLKKDKTFLHLDSAKF